MNQQEKDRPRTSARRKAWVTPTFDQLATSEAEFGAGTHVDAEGFS